MLGVLGTTLVSLGLLGRRSAPGGVPTFGGRSLEPSTSANIISTRRFGEATQMGHETLLIAFCDPICDILNHWNEMWDDSLILN